MCIKYIKGLMAVLALAGAALVTGCADCAPVREEITTVSTYPAAVAELESIETVEAAPILETSSCANGIY